MERPIYLDNHSTTKLDPRVLDAMLPYLSDRYGNPSNRSHSYGMEAKCAVEDARESVAALINARSSEIIFTSGATESNNIALHNHRKIMMSSVEHSSVYNLCRRKSLDKPEDIIELKVDGSGEVDLYHAMKLNCDYDIASVMLVNNEVGTIQPIKQLRELFSNVPFHSDMAQALGKIPIDVKDLGVDLASFSAHKLYGPKGIGALYVSSEYQDKLKPIMFGGGQEMGYRPGTLNVSGIVGFGKACDIAYDEMNVEFGKIKELRRIFYNNFVDCFHVLGYHGHENNVPGNLNISIPCNNMDAFEVIIRNQVALSYGAACNSGNGVSRVLLAMGVDEEEAKRSIRICFGRFNTKKEVRRAAKIICESVHAANAIA